MISFALTEEQEIARSIVLDFARSVLRPQAKSADDRGEFGRAALQGAWDLGLIRSVASVEDGMPEQATVLNTLLLEELARGDAAVAMAIAAPLGFAKAIAEQGSDRQKHELLPLYAGDRIRLSTVAVTDSGFAPGQLGGGTTALKMAAGYRLAGTKNLVPLARECSHFLVTARCEGNIDAFIVTGDATGLVVKKAKGTLGLRPLAMSEIELRNVFVPMDMRLGENAGANVQRIADSSRVALSAMLTGLSRAVFEYALPYTKERVVHGEAIAKKQSVAFKLADMHIHIEAMRWMALKAASELDGRATSARSARLAQRYSAANAMWIADEGLQIFGGHGFAREYPLEMWYRNARSLSVLDGLVGA